MRWRYHARWPSLHWRLSLTAQDVELLALLAAGLPMEAVARRVSAGAAVPGLSGATEGRGSAVREGAVPEGAPQRAGDTA